LNEGFARKEVDQKVKYPIILAIDRVKYQIFVKKECEGTCLNL
jgi:hypothetical protein